MSDARLDAVRQWVDDEVAPVADAWDRNEAIPRDFLDRAAGFGLFGCANCVPGDGPLTPAPVQGRLFEEIGRGSLSLVSVLTVHAMAVHALGRWGTHAQQAVWLPALLKGEKLGAFALSEPTIGSDARNVRARLQPDGDGWRLDGRKKWISGAQLADVFIIIARVEEQTAAVIVPRETLGLKIRPIRGMLGFRGAMLAELEFDNVRLPAESLLGAVGMGFSHVAGSSLDLGRFHIASGATGLIRACLEASFAYARERVQFETALDQHQLIRGMLANMATSYKAARALCAHAAELREEGDPASIAETTVAKYFASTAASRAASDAVQIHGANGCSEDYPVQRYFRDARITEIIEGTNQMQQLLISQHGTFEFRKSKRPKV